MSLKIVGRPKPNAKKSGLKKERYGKGGKLK